MLLSLLSLMSQRGAPHASVVSFSLISLRERQVSRRCAIVGQEVKTPRLWRLVLLDLPVLFSSLAFTGLVWWPLPSPAPYLVSEDIVLTFRGKPAMASVGILHEKSSWQECQKA